GDVATVDWVVSPAKIVHDDKAVEMLGVHQFAILACLEVENQKNGILARAGTMVAAGRNVSHAAALIGRDAVDAVVRNGNRIDLGLAGLRVIHHRIAAGIVLALFLGRVGIALLGAKVDLAAGADVVAGMNFRLSSEAL